MNTRNNKQVSIFNNHTLGSKLENASSPTSDIKSRLLKNLAIGSPARSLTKSKQSRIFPEGQNYNDSFRTDTECQINPTGTSYSNKRKEAFRFEKSQFHELDIFPGQNRASKIGSVSPTRKSFNIISDKVDMNSGKELPLITYEMRSKITSILKKSLINKIKKLNMSSKKSSNKRPRSPNPKKRKSNLVEILDIQNLNLPSNNLTNLMDFKTSEGSLTPASRLNSLNNRSVKNLDIKEKAGGNSSFTYSTSSLDEDSIESMDKISMKKSTDFLE